MDAPPFAVANAIARRLAEPFLHGINDGFMFPASNAALRAGRTVSPVHCLEAAGHSMPGRAAVLVPVRQVDEVLLAEPAARLGA